MPQPISLDEIIMDAYKTYKPEELEEYEPTNADHIRETSDEDLAEFLLKVNTAYTKPCMLSGEDYKWEDYPTHDKGCKDCFLEY